MKLWQMDADDLEAVRIDTNDPAAWHHEPGRQTCALHERGRERTTLQRLQPGAALGADTTGGAELLVLTGSLIEQAQPLPALSWLRLPPHPPCGITAGTDGATLYLKTGHLADTPR